MTTWFTSDQHYDHKNIIEFCKRPFTDVDHMNEMLIHNYNELVQPEDTVYHLGDLQFSADINKFLPRLNGKKILIKGNHDYQHPAIFDSPHWESVHDALLVNINSTMIYLHHYACRVWPRAHKGSLNLFGHSHNRLSGNSQSCDVGVDAWNYRPVQLKDIRKRMKTLQEYRDDSFRDQQP